MSDSDANKASVKPLKIACHSCWQKLDVTGVTAFTKILCPACQAEIQVPKRLATMLLEEPLADGELATVYRALDLTLDREVAVKVLKREASVRGGSKNAFLTEAKNAAAMNNPNILPIFSCGTTEEDNPYIVMEFMGASLDQVIREYGTNINVDAVLFYAAEVARGLEGAQDYQIVHHDLKPSNILLDISNNVKVSDFGLNWALRGHGHAVPLDDLAAVNRMPLYYSPEKLETGREDFRGDIYSLGAIMYHLLTGFPPFYQGDVVLSLRSRLSCLPRTPDDLRDNLPPGISDLVMSMLALRPEGRPRCYADIIHEIDSARGKAPGSATGMPASALAKNRISGGEQKFAAKKIIRSQSSESRARTRRVRAKRKKWNSLINMFVIINLIVLLLLVFLWLKKRSGTQLPALRGRAEVSAPAAQVIDTAPAEQAGEISPAAPLQPAAAVAVRNTDQDLRPDDLDFRMLRQQMDAYLRKQPQELQPIEKQRLEYLSGFREYLITLISFRAYDTRGEPLVLGDGRMLNGTFGPATRRGITYKPAAAGAAPAQIGWDELNVEHYKRIFLYYITEREKEAEATTYSRYEVDRQVASDYLRLAIICDWYEQKDEAAKYVRLALRRDTKVSPLIRTLLGQYAGSQ